MDADPWTNATETDTLTTEWAEYTLHLTTEGFGGEGNRLFFDLGADAGQVQLDNIQVWWLQMALHLARDVNVFAEMLMKAIGNIK